MSKLRNDYEDFFSKVKICINGPKGFWQKIKFWWKPWPLEFQEFTAMAELEKHISEIYKYDHELKSKLLEGTWDEGEK